MAKQEKLDTPCKALVSIYLESVGHKHPAKDGEEAEVFMLSKSEAEGLEKLKYVAIGRPAQA